MFPPIVVEKFGARLGSSLLPQQPVRTGCQALDNALGGGLHRGEITELFGALGSGRTQLALSICAEAVTSGSTVVYIDADGSFIFDRAKALIQTRQSSDARMPCTNETIQQTLSRWFLCRVCSFDELAGGVAHALPSMLSERDNVAVIVVDSVSQLYRAFDGQAAQKRLEACAGRFAEMAISMNAAVIFVNHARVHEPSAQSANTFEGSVSREVGLPAMGETWSYVSPTRIGLGCTPDGEKVAHILKSSRVPRQSVFFQISDRGVS